MKRKYRLLPRMKILQQKSRDDCGIFVCAMARALCENKVVKLSTEDAKFMRRRMAYEIVHNELIEGFF